MLDYEFEAQHQDASYEVWQHVTNGSSRCIQEYPQHLLKKRYQLSPGEEIVIRQHDAVQFTLKRVQ